MKTIGTAHPGYDSPGSVAGVFDSYMRAREATGLGAFSDRVNDMYQTSIDRENTAKKMAMEQAKLDLTTKEFGLKQDEVNRVNKERIATNEALQSVLNPNKYGAAKIDAEQKAIQDSLANLSPQDRLVAEQQLKANYNPETSKQGWLDYAPTVAGVDTGKLFEAKNRDYEIKVKTPGTPEYIAAENARMNIFKQEQAISHANRMGEIGAQNAGQMAYLRASQDAPREMVDPTSGKAYYVKPSEASNYPSNLIAKDTLSAFLTNTREQSKIEQDRRKYEQERVLKGKEALSESVSVLGNQDSTLSVIGDMNKLASDMGVTLTDADMSNAIKATTNGSGWTDRGKPDVDTSLLRDRLMQVISTQSKKPLEDVLKKYDGTSSTKAIETAPNLKGSNKEESFSMFGVTAPTEYNAVQFSNNSYSNIDPKEVALKAKYLLLPEYVKKDVSLSKYMDSPNSYEALIRK